LLLGSGNYTRIRTRMLTLSQIKPKLILAVPVLVVLFVVFTLVAIFTSGKKTPAPSAIPQSSINPQVLIPPKQTTETKTQDIKQIRDKIIASQIAQDKGDIILFTSPAYRIIYVPTPDIFFVMITKDPQTSRDASQKWFLDFGLNQDNLCTLPVRFVINDFQLKKQFPDFNPLPDNCSP